MSLLPSFLFIFWVRNPKERTFQCAREENFTSASDAPFINHKGMYSNIYRPACGPIEGPQYCMSRGELRTQNRG